MVYLISFYDLQAAILTPASSQSMKATTNSVYTSAIRNAEM